MTAQLRTYEIAVYRADPISIAAECYAHHESADSYVFSADGITLFEIRRRYVVSIRDTATTVGPVPAEMSSPLGKAAPRSRPGLPSIGPGDELQHPAWPHIDDEAETAPDCARQRTEYSRTRCADETCRRCWLGGPVNWPSRA